MQHFRLDLLSTLGPFQSKPPAALCVARPSTVVALGQCIIASLRLLHSLLSVERLLLRVQTFMLLLLPSPLDLGSQGVEVLVHLVQRESKLHAVVAHALVHSQHLAQLQRIAATLGVRSPGCIQLSPSETLQSLGLFLFQSRAFPQKVGKVARRRDALLEPVQEGVDADVRVHDNLNGLGRARRRIVGHCWRWRALVRGRRAGRSRAIGDVESVAVGLVDAVSVRHAACAGIVFQC